MDYDRYVGNAAAPLTFPHLPAEMPDSGAEEKDLEKSREKVVGNAGVRSSYMRKTGNRQGARLTPEGTAGGTRAGAS